MEFIRTISAILMMFPALPLVKKYWQGYFAAFSGKSQLFYLFLTFILFIFLDFLLKIIYNIIKLKLTNDNGRKNR